MNFCFGAINIKVSLRHGIIKGSVDTSQFRTLPSSLDETVARFAECGYPTIVQVLDFEGETAGRSESRDTTCRGNVGPIQT